MAEPRGISWISIVVAVGVAAAVAYGATFVFNKEKVDETAKAPAAAPPTPTAPAKPPKVEFLSAVKAAGPTTALPAGFKGNPVTTYTDDLQIVFLRVTTDGAPTRANSPRLNITDEKGRSYSYAQDQRDGGLVILRLKKGYDKPVKELTVTAGFDTSIIGTWKLHDIPAPESVIPDSQIPANPVGTVELRPGRRGRLSANILIKAGANKSMGFVLKPIAESHVVLDPKRYEPIHFLAKPGEDYSSPIPLPNPDMNKCVSFDYFSYEGVTETDTVTFHGVHMESRFGQPTMVVDGELTATSQLGNKVTLVKQDNGPHRAPRKVHPYASLNVSYELAKGKEPELAFIQPAVIAEVAAPTAESLGLEAIPVVLNLRTDPDAESVFQLSPSTKHATAGGAFKFGPVGDLTIKFSVIQAKPREHRRIFLPVKMSKDPAPGGMPVRRMQAS